MQNKLLIISSTQLPKEWFSDYQVTEGDKDKIYDGQFALSIVDSCFVDKINNIPMLVIISKEDDIYHFNHNNLLIKEYIFYPFSEEEFLFRLNILVQKNIFYKKNSNEADLDYLTQVFNKRYLETSLKKLVEEKSKFSLIMLDINNFHKLNNLYGHVQCDIMLKNFATNLNSIFRKGDIVGRFGGDEFMIILPNITAAQVEQIIISRIENSVNKNSEIELKISWGIAESYPDLKWEEIISCADKNLISQKLLKKGRI